MSEHMNKKLVITCLLMVLLSALAVPAYASEDAAVAEQASVTEDPGIIDDSSGIVKFGDFILGKGSLDDGGNYIGPDGCKFCHMNNYEQWLQTNHSRAFETLVGRNQQNNENCLPCHVTGWNSVTKTYKFKDVTCEVCHSSGDISNNIVRQVVEIMYGSNNMSTEDTEKLLDEMNVNKDSMVKDLRAELCGRCHTDKHHPQYEEWNDSKHAQSLNDLRTNDHATSECLECHSSEYITAGEHAKPTLETVTTPLTCPACHNVHSADYEKLLRKPKKQLCEDCHTMGEAKPGSAPHHSQTEMRLSHGGVDTDTYIYQPNAQCADCHKYSVEYNATGMNETAITGHDFKLNFGVCLVCHEAFPTAEFAEQYVKNQQTLTMLKFNQTMVRVEMAGSIAKQMPDPTYMRVYNDSIFNMQMFEADKSEGAHNPKYSDELIDKADIKAQNIISGQPETSGMASLPGFGIMTGTVMFLLVVLSMKRRLNK